MEAQIASISEPRKLEKIWVDICPNLYVDESEENGTVLFYILELRMAEKLLRFPQRVLQVGERERTCGFYFHVFRAKTGQRFGNTHANLCHF